MIFNKKLVTEKQERNFFKFLTIVAIASSILMSQLVPWRFFPKMLVMIQFPWRLETILILALSIMGAIACKNLQKRKTKVIAFAIIGVLVGITVYNSYNFYQIQVKNIEDIDLSYWGMGWEREYLPEVTTENMDYFNNRGNDIKVSNDSTNAEIVESKTPYLEAKVEGTENGTVLEFPRIYYSGYTAVLIDDDGNKTDLELYMNGNGFVETVINSDGTIILEYEGTAIQKVANIICVMTILIILLIIIYNKRKDKKEKKYE